MAQFTSAAATSLKGGRWQIDVYSSGGAGTAALTYAADGTNYRAVDVSSQYSGTGSGGFILEVGEDESSNSYTPMWKMTLTGDAVAYYYQVK